MLIINNKTSIILLAGALTLAGCGGGNNSSNASNPTNASKSISGSVLGSYIEGAKVCIDENENARCDATDQYTIKSGTNGQYSFSSIPASAFNKPIVVEVPETAMVVDPVTNTKTRAVNEYRLSFPPSGESERFVSSLSTLVNSEYLQSGDVNAAKQRVKEQLNNAGLDIKDDELLGNYVTSATGASSAEKSRKTKNIQCGQTVW